MSKEHCLRVRASKENSFCHAFFRKTFLCLKGVFAIHCQSLSTMPKEAAAVKKRRRQLRDNSVEHLLRASSIICTRNASFEQNFRSWYPLGRRGGCWARQKDTYHQNSSNILASLSIRAHFGSQIEWCHGRPRAAVDAQGFVAYDSIEGPSFLA